MFSNGQRVRLKNTTSLYRASDEPQNVIGTVEGNTKATVIMGPHMGKVYIKTDSGQGGWVINNTLERVVE